MTRICVLSLLELFTGESALTGYVRTRALIEKSMGRWINYEQRGQLFI